MKIDNLIFFECAKGWDESEINLPQRATAGSAGYDFEVAEDTVIYPYATLMKDLKMSEDIIPADTVMTLDAMAAITKTRDAKPTLVPTGVKCHMPKDCYLELAVRSSLPLKSWLVLPNGQGIIDSDYYNNETNDGAIYFQLINLSPYPILLHKGDRIGQGIIKRYLTTFDDEASGERTGGLGSTNG